MDILSYFEPCEGAAKPFCNYLHRCKHGIVVVVRGNYFSPGLVVSSVP